MIAQDTHQHATDAWPPFTAAPHGLARCAAGRACIHTHGILVLAALTVVLLCCRGVAGQPADWIPSAGAGEHLWFIPPAGPDEDSYRILYSSSRMDPPRFVVAGTLTRSPEAVTAVNNRVYLVLPPEHGAEHPRRSVYSLQMVYQEATDGYFAEPAHRLSVREALPADGRLVGMVGHAAGPVALLVPPSARRTTTPASRDSGNDRTIDRPTLLQLGPTGWSELELPEGINVNEQTILAIGGEDHEQLYLLTVPDGTSRNATIATQVHRRDGSGSWERYEADVDLSRVITTTRVEQQPTLISRQRRADHDRLQVQYLRQSRVVELAEEPIPDTPWMVGGMDDRLMIIWIERPQRQRTRLMYRSIDPLTGQVSAPQVLERHRPAAAAIWLSAIIIGFLIFGVLLAFLLRPSPREPLVIASTVRLAPISTRTLAVVIDVLPAAVIAMVVTGANLEDLLHVPMVTPDVLDTVPYLIMTAIFVGHTAVTELFNGSSIGKLVLRLHVNDHTGVKPGLRAVLLRALGKVLTFLIPPIALFVLLNPYRQAMGDLLAQTIVVVRQSDVDDASDENQPPPGEG